ncbi:MAG: ion transporter [Bacteroidales bacterium]|nr:ion transporter [Bacteroidales bacterium]
MSNWRRYIYETVEYQNGTAMRSRVYNGIMLGVIIASVVPLAVREQSELMLAIDRISVSIFIIDYILRWITADFGSKRETKWVAFLIYPFTLSAIIDMLSILPSIVSFDKVFKVFRLTRFLKIIRLFKLFRYSKQLELLFRVMKKEGRVLISVLMIAMVYIVVTALIMFNIENEMAIDKGIETNFQSFFDALYWSATTLTTVGYGDMVPITDVGRVISMISAIFGVAVIALPSGVITASYLDELREMKNKGKESKESVESKE